LPVNINEKKEDNYLFYFCENVTSMIDKPDLLVVKLMAKLEDPDPRIRRNATGALRMQGFKAYAAVSAIQPLLGDSDPSVRREAERTLEMLDALLARA
jgi:HEAT repeat protein